MFESPFILPDTRLDCRKNPYSPYQITTKRKVPLNSEHVVMLKKTHS